MNYTIIRDGKEIELTSQEVYDIYRKQEKAYQLEDAEYFFNQFIEDYEITDEHFEERMGYTIEQAKDPNSEHYILGDMVNMFNKRCDCNIADNSTWEVVTYFFYDELVREDS